MFIFNPIRLASIGMTVLVCVGCTALAPTPAPQAHVLNPAVSSVVNPDPAGPSLYVSAVRAHGPYATNLMAYREKAFQLDYFSRNVWAADPATLIEPWLWQSLESSGQFGPIVSGTGAPPTQYRLDTLLLALRHEFDAEPSQVRIVMRATLFDLENRVLMGTTRLDLTESAVSADAYGGVVATNRLMVKLLDEINRFCARALTGGETMMVN